MDIELLAAKLEIQEQLAHYAHGVDRADADLLRSVFTEDAVLDYSKAGIPKGSRDEVCGFFIKAFSESMVWAQHYITNFEIDLNEARDEAAVTAMFYNPCLIPGMEEPSIFGGFYTHEFVKTPDGWKSKHVIEHPVFSVNPPPKPENLTLDS